MGNNEMVGPFGAVTVFGAKAPPRWMVRLGLSLQTTRVGQLAASTAHPGLYFNGFTHSLRGHLFEANLASRRLARNVERYLLEPPA